MAPSELDILIRKRGYVMQRFTKLHTEIQAQLPTLIVEQKNKYIERLLNLQSELEKHNENIVEKYLDNGMSDEAIEGKEADTPQYEKRLLEVVNLLKNTATSSSATADSAASNATSPLEQSYPRKL